MSQQDISIKRLAMWGRISAISLSLVLIAGATFGPWAAHATSVQTAYSKHLSSLEQNLEAAVTALNNETVYEERARFDPSALNLSKHREYTSAFEIAMEGMLGDGSSSDRSLAASVLDKHRRYLEGTSRMFAAASARRPVSDILRIDRTSVDPIHAHIADLVGQAESQLDLDLSQAQERFQKIDRFTTQVSIGISSVGLIFLAIFFFVLESYRKRTADIYRTEIRRLELAALTDNLTSLGNHRAFEDDLQREVARAVRHEEALSLALIDVDDLKAVNDSGGHKRGDDVLVGLSRLLLGLRVKDRAYRIGGDEFAVLLPNTTSNEATVAMDRLRAAVQSRLGGVTISVGIASGLGNDRDQEIIRAQADAALYAAKRAGRNIVEDFHEEKDGMWLLSTTKVRGLRQLIVDAKMGVAFQPIWDVSRCNVLAYEALARPDEKYGFRGPQEAFDLAERIGRTHELDGICRDAILERASELPSDALLFINVCPQTLNHKGFDATRLADQVRQAGLHPERVVVEITERTVTNLDTVIAAAQDLRRHGFRLALDDTGSGNSGLELLSKLPLDFVKIDRLIVVNATKYTGARGVLAGIVAIARAIGAYIIAEGIEDEQMLQMVCGAELGESARNTGVHGVQGYLLRRPSESIPEPTSLRGVRALLRRVAGSDTADNQSSYPRCIRAVAG